MNYHYDKDAGEYPIRWIETYLTHTIGEKKGQPFLLDDWQKEIVRQAFGWKKEDGKLKHRIVYVEVPRGNGKSTFGIGVGMYIFAGSGIQSSHVFCVASSRDQAGGAIFEPAKIMVQQNPFLDEEFSLYFNSVQDYSTNSFFKLLSSDWKGAHSLIPSAVLFDELHLQPDGALWDGFITGMNKRTDCTPQMWVFTTAGQTETWPEKIHNYALDVKEGRRKDETFLPFIFSADTGDDPFDEQTWAKANPGWHFINQDGFRSSSDRAKNEPSFLNTFKQYHLNIWTGNQESWIPMHEWDECGGQIDIEKFKGMKCFAGMDLASVRDLSSLCLIFEDGEEVHFFWWFWCPKKQIYVRTYYSNDYELWWKDGFLDVTPGDAQDYSYIKDRILKIAEEYELVMLRYDPKFASQLVIELNDLGVKLEPLSQSGKNITPPTQLMEKLVIEKRLKHGDNPVMRWQIGNCDVKRNQFGDVRPVKSSEEKKIDGIYAAVMALSSYIDYGQEPESITLTEGIQFV